MRHPRIIQFEKTLQNLFEEVDDHLEDHYGSLFPLHPARAPRGTTSSKEQSGLFNVGAAFTAGYGSRLGKGYIVEIRMVTLDFVPDYVRDEIIADAMLLVRHRLPYYFPDRTLNVERDGAVFKIHGDLSVRSSRGPVSGNESIRTRGA